jgi:hypothetical protein
VPASICGAKLASRCQRAGNIVQRDRCITLRSGPA